MTKQIQNIIPVGWTSKKVSQVFDFLSTNSFSRSQLHYDVNGNSIHNIHYGDIHSTYKEPILDLYKESCVPVLIDGLEVPNSVPFLQDGDLIMADASEDYAGVGETVELTNVGSKKVIAGLHTFALRDKDGHTTKGFRTYLFKHPKVAIEVKVIATGSKVYGISKTNLANVKVILPPLAEQQKIATIFSTWDKAIDKLTQLITAKELRKKGLMQQLLTGKNRFAEFTDVWNEKKLTQLVKYFGGAAFKSSDKVNSGLKWLKIANVGVGDIKWEENEFLPEEFGLSFHRYYLLTGDVVMALTRPILSGKLKIAQIKSKNDESLLNQRVAKLIPFENNDVIYIFYLHQLDRVIYLIESTIAGTDPPNISVNDMSLIKIKVPKLTEQKKIASVLSAADKEIEILKKELASLQQQKKGLMQVLLTGAKRVKI